MGGTLLAAPGTWAGRAGLSWVAGWQGLFYTLGPEAGWRVEGLGLRLVSGWHTLRPVSDCAEGAGAG